MIPNKSIAYIVLLTFSISFLDLRVFRNKTKVSAPVCVYVCVVLLSLDSDPPRWMLVL